MIRAVHDKAKIVVDSLHLVYCMSWS